METLGLHKRAEVSDTKDINNRFMVTCRDCETTAHAYKLEEARFNLSMVSCSPNCQNCKKLRHSYDRAPAVPIGGSCNDKLHVCPNDGNRWWQGNDYFHLWQQVTNDKEWEHLRKQEGFRR